jgi:choline-glycine betaine transporter
MKLPSFKDLDHKKIIAIAVLILAITFAAIILSSKFSTIKVLGVELETKTEAVEKEETSIRRPQINQRRNRNGREVIEVENSRGRREQIERKD